MVGVWESDFHSTSHLYICDTAPELEGSFGGVTQDEAVHVCAHGCLGSQGTYAA